MLKYVFGALILIAVLLGISTLFGSFYTVDEGERGVLLRNGSFTNVAEPGLGFKLPFIDTIKEISVRDAVRNYDTPAPNGDGIGLAAYSKDQQTAYIRLSVNYRITPDQVAELYSQYGSEDNLVLRLIDPKVYEQVKNVFGSFNAATSIQERPRLNAEIQNAVKNSIVGPVQILSVQIEDIAFSDAYEQAIEARMTAEVDVQKVRQTAEKKKIDAQITVIEAQAQADSKLAVAKADAESIRIRGDAEADAIRAKSDALKESPNLIQLTQAEKWNGVLPTTMVPGGTVPFLDIRGVAEPEPDIKPVQ